MKSKHLLSAICLVAIALVISSCQRRQMHVDSSHEVAIAVNQSLDEIADTAYLNILEPYKVRLNAELDEVIGHAPEAMRVAKPESNMLNWSADALREMAHLKTGKDIDMAVVNIGGLRCEWEAGDIRLRNVYELMPFDNKLVVLSLSGKDLLDLAQCFADTMGQGVSGMRLTIRQRKAENVTLNGKKIVPQMLYQVATSDYLSEGNDHMEPLANYTAIEKTDITIRDLYTEYIKLHPVVEAKVDGRTKVVR